MQASLPVTVRALLACGHFCCRAAARGPSRVITAVLHDYAARKANVTAAETALWDEELSLHAADAGVAEDSVLNQRQLEWRFRENPKGWATVQAHYKFPFVPTAEPAKLK